MKNLDFLKKYVLPAVTMEENEPHGKNKHHFSAVLPGELSELEHALGKIPVELEDFYTTIGHGKFHIQNATLNNCIFPLKEMELINLKLGEYALDPDLDVYDCFSIGKRLLFFNVMDGIYLFIDKEEKDHKNAIYYFDLKIYDSLTDFIIALDKNPELLTEISKNY